MWAIFCQPRNKDRSVDPPCLDPLDYGRDGEPFSDKLLRRGRVRLFATKEDALSALQELGRSDGEKQFMKEFAFTILECTHAHGTT